MKKALAVLLVFSMVFCLFSCSDGQNDIISDVTEKIAETVSSTIKATEIESTELMSDSVSDIPYVFQSSNFCQPVSVPKLSTHATAEFGFKLFKEAIKEETNALISPVSLITALAMTANGANGKTLEEIENVMGAHTDIFNQNFSAENFYGFGLKSANSIWVRNTKNLKLKENFVNANRKYYSAEIFKEDFDKATLSKINRWISDSTDGAIQNGLDAISSQAVIYLINTVLFDAEWKEKYSEHRAIKNQTFTDENGVKQTVTMLHSQESDLNVFRLGKTKGVTKAYTNGYAFAAMLPDEGVTVEQALESFTGNDFLKCLAPDEPPLKCGTYCPYDIYIPKFEFDCKFKFKDILKKLGMNAPFDEAKADFSKMAECSFPLYISDVYHNTSIAFSENGTKAGAATIVEMKAGSAMVQNPVLRFDRPFIYVIYHIETGLPLFIGTVRDFLVKTEG